MNIFSEGDEIKEILIEDVIRTEDNGKIILPTVGERKEGIDELTKEIIANDALALGPSLASKIHGVPQSSASKYSNGIDVSEDAKTRILSTKHNIADLATAKLMESLNLFDPTCIEKEKDRVLAASHLANIVEKMTAGGKNEGTKIELHMYAPKQRPLKEYEVIEVR